MTASRSCPRLAAVAAAVAACLPGAAQAHGVPASVGDFYGGGLHLLTAPEHLLTIVGLGLLLGRGDREVADEPLLFVVPAALAVGGCLSLLTGPWAGTRWIGVVSLLGLGGLVAAGLRPPRPALAGVVLLAGLAHGFANGEAMTMLTDPRRFVPGVAAAGFLLAFYAMALARLARPFWASVAVRVAGSWIAATGILVLGMRH